MVGKKNRSCKQQRKKTGLCVPKNQFENVAWAPMCVPNTNQISIRDGLVSYAAYASDHPEKSPKSRRINGSDEKLSQESDDWMAYLGCQKNCGKFFKNLRIFCRPGLLGFLMLPWRSQVGHWRFRLITGSFCMFWMLWCLSCKATNLDRKRQWIGKAPREWWWDESLTKINGRKIRRYDYDNGCQIFASSDTMSFFRGTSIET